MVAAARNVSVDDELLKEVVSVEIITFDEAICLWSLLLLIQRAREPDGDNWKTFLAIHCFH